LSTFPWRPTLREFVESALGNGYSFRFAKYFGQDVFDPETLSYPDRRERAIRQLVIITGLEEDERMTPTVLRSLCARLGIPPELFQLEPEPPYDERDRDE
jgi:hypothetical protein